MGNRMVPRFRPMLYNKFEKDLFKLMNNFLFGNTMENIRNHCHFDICNDPIVLRKLVQNPNFYGVVEINEDMLLVEKSYTQETNVYWF